MFFSSPDSGDGVLEPLPLRTPKPVTQNRRAKDLLEKQKDWVFLSPEDYDLDSSADDASGISEYGPDGLEEKKKTPLERYYDRLEQSRINATNQIRSSDQFRPAQWWRGRGLFRVWPPLIIRGARNGAMRSKLPSRNQTGDTTKRRVSMADADRGFSDFFGFDNSRRLNGRTRGKRAWRN